MGRFRTGQTALIVPVPEAEPVVGQWRERHDSSAAYGVPAHVSVLYPFLQIEWVDQERLEALFAGFAPFEVEYARCGRFPDVLYLAPEPDEPFRALTEAVWERWPEAPPYKGEFEGIIPHLTIGEGGHSLDQVEQAVTSELPFRARTEAVTLLVFDGTRWRATAEFPLRA